MRGIIKASSSGNPTCSIHSNADAVEPTFGAWTGKAGYRCRHCGAFEYEGMIK